MTRINTIVATLVLFATPALAQQRGEVVTRVVSYGDLDLRSPAGRASLERRVEAAARRVCPVRPPLNVVNERELNAVNACQDAALAGAREQLAGLYEGRQRLATAMITVSGQVSR